MAVERWKAVSGYEGYYEVSDLGRVRSLTRLVVYSDGRQRTYPAQVLKPSPAQEGHCRVNLSRSGVGSLRFVHTLVMEAFVGQCPEGMECRHLDGDPTNNKLGNLRWGTRKKNAEDRVAHGVTPRGNGYRNYKLTKAQVRKIRDDPRQNQEIAAAHKISAGHVSRIKNKRIWLWL